MIIAWDYEAWADYLYWQSQDKKTLKRINEIIKDIQRNGSQGIGKAEKLKYVDGNWYSRRIDKTNRLVYKLDNNILKIIQCKGHYDD